MIQFYCLIGIGTPIILVITQEMMFGMSLYLMMVVIPWIDIQNTSSSITEWKNQTILTDLITLTETIQFKFIAEDIVTPGDNGSGGSLVEAAIDNFLIENIVSNTIQPGDTNNDNQLNVLDVVILVNMVLGAETQNFLTADLNNDAQINVQDIVILINLILEV